MRPVLLFALVAGAVFGCQPASRYSPRGADGKEKSTAAADQADAPPLSPDLTWIDPKDDGPRNPVRIEFVQWEKDPIGWVKLEKFWTLTNGPAQAAAVIGALPLMPIPAPILAAPDPQVVKIRVPRGLDDPTPFLPAANPPTLARWELGRELFFDPTWLSPKGNVSCAGCHLPEKGFTDGFRDHDGFNTPTLINVVYQPAIFWDGRASCLEEVVARSLEDERETDRAGPFRHTWGGGIGRLQRGKYLARFKVVFGTPPTQDAVGKALATYLRTLLAGDSLHDRALAEQVRRKGEKLEKDDYLAALALDAAALKRLEPKEDRPRDEVADDLSYGYRLFTDQIPGRQLHCASCHAGRQFTDGQFHNVGVVKEDDFRDPRWQGRFLHVPIGRKGRELVGAFKTPTLRGLLRSAPYFHDGSAAGLEEALVFHTSGFNTNSAYLARPFRETDNWYGPARVVKLTPPELRALTLFLKSLDGGEVDASVTTPPAPPKGP